MPILRRGDPRRPLFLAVSSCRLLGVLGLLVGTCAGIGMLRGGGGRGGVASLVSAIAALAFYGGGGAAYLVFAHFIKRRRFWAVVAALVLTTVLAVLLLIGVAVQLVAIGSIRGVTFQFFTGLIVVELLILVAVGQLIYHLARSFAALKIALPDEARGFDVLPVPAVATEGPDDDPAPR